MRRYRKTSNANDFKFLDASMIKSTTVGLLKALYVRSMDRAAEHTRKNMKEKHL